MPGAPISRWTMSYFAIGIGCLILALTAMSVGFGYPAGGVAAPDTLVVIHLIAIGWLGLLFCGALLQFVPVLAAAKARLASLAAPALIMLVCELSALLTGFLSLGGWLELDLAIMPIGGICLAAGFVTLALSFACTILSQKSVDHSGRLVLIGLGSLLVTLALGVAFTGLVSGFLSWDFGAALLEHGLPIHAFSGIVGWMSVMAVGVSYRLFSMFMLAPETGFRTRPLFFSVVAGLGALWLGLVLALLDPESATAAAWSAILLFALALIHYLADIGKMVRSRRRKVLELNTIAGVGAISYLILGLALLVLARIFPDKQTLGPAAIYAMAMGWLSGLGLAQLYKIVPFLTWLEAYGPVMGRSAVPRVQDLVKETRGRVWFVLYHVGVVIGMAALILDMEILFRLAAWAELVAVVGLAVELFRARRLGYAPCEIRLPQGAVCPHLLYANHI